MGVSVAAARLWAAHRFPYLASALFALQPVLRPGLGGAATDESWRLYLDPELADGWPADRLGTLLVHHVGHLVREHADRARAAGVDPRSAPRWALAADAELNDDLADAGLALPGRDGVTPEALGLDRGGLAEAYFAALAAGASAARDERDDREQRDGEGTGGDHGSGADGRRRHWEAPADAAAVSRADAELIRAGVAVAVLEARHDGRGDVPGSWLRWAEDRVTPHVDWRRVLAGEIRRGVSAVAGAVDYSYRRPSRRSGAAPRVVLPSLEEPVPEVAVVCDTSGSMGGEELGVVLAEVEALLRRVGVRGARVLAVDAAVRSARRVSRARQVELAGGGGTDMAAGIEAALLARPRPDIVVVLTDGDTPWPEQRPRGTRVVAALVGGGRRAAVPGWARTVEVGERP